MNFRLDVLVRNTVGYFVQVTAVFITMPYATCTLHGCGTALKHPNIFQTLHVFYSILFQDKVTVAQAYFSIISGLTN
jgi:hypothetical protein